MKPLTEQDDFRATITVPEDTDPRTASSYETTVQQLANRNRSQVNGIAAALFGEHENETHFCDVQLLTSVSDDSWVKPPGEIIASFVVGLGGGGGGGGGQRSPSDAEGGAGGGSGVLAWALLVGDQLSEANTFTVGAGGAGGLGATPVGGLSTHGAAGGQSLVQDPSGSGVDIRFAGGLRGLRGATSYATDASHPNTELELVRRCAPRGGSGGLQTGGGNYPGQPDDGDYLGENFVVPPQVGPGAGGNGAGGFLVSVSPEPAGDGVNGDAPGNPVVIIPGGLAGNGAGSGGGGGAGAVGGGGGAGGDGASGAIAIVTFWKMRNGYHWLTSLVDRPLAWWSADNTDGQDLSARFGPDLPAEDDHDAHPVAFVENGWGHLRRSVTPAVYRANVSSLGLNVESPRTIVVCATIHSVPATDQPLYVFDRNTGTDRVDLRVTSGGQFNFRVTGSGTNVNENLGAVPLNERLIIIHTHVGGNVNVYWYRYEQGSVVRSTLLSGAASPSVSSGNLTNLSLGHSNLVSELDWSFRELLVLGKGLGASDCDNLAAALHANSSPLGSTQPL